MQFRTIVNIPTPEFTIQPADNILFVGSCFADNLGKRFQEHLLQTTCNPMGVMYNPVSIMHTVTQMTQTYDVAFFTLGTNHVYRDVNTQQIVDNCMKRPAKDFVEEELTVTQCAEALQNAVCHLMKYNPRMHVVITVSPIRYSKYGFHESQLAKSILLLAARQCEEACGTNVSYFPAYEIILDELRDYRFYNPDMIHPSQQAVDYIWERVSEIYFSEETRQLIKEYLPIKKALGHKPFHTDTPQYREFHEKTMQMLHKFMGKYPHTRPLLARCDLSVG